MTTKFEGVPPPSGGVRLFLMTNLFSLLLCQVNVGRRADDHCSVVLGYCGCIVRIYFRPWEINKTTLSPSLVIICHGVHRSLTSWHSLVDLHVFFRYPLTWESRDIRRVIYCTALSAFSRLFLFFFNRTVQLHFRSRVLSQEHLCRRSSRSFHWEVAKCFNFNVVSLTMKFDGVA